MRLRVRAWVRYGLLVVAVVVVLLVVAIESGLLVRLFASPSDWQPEPMPALQMECDTHGQGETTVRYCVTRAPDSRSRDVVLHFHGRRGTERWWNDRTYYPAELYEQWRSMGVDAPTVVSVSFGPLWVLTDETATALRDALPTLLALATPTPPQRVFVVGESMGGYNALLAAFDPPVPLDGVAALCPPLSADGPFGLDALGRLSESSPAEALMLLTFARHFFRDDAHWRSTDPVARAQRGDVLQPRLHVSCGSRDPWGCLLGGEALSTALRESGADIDWRVLPEGHCAIDTAALARFLVP